MEKRGRSVYNVLPKVKTTPSPWKRLEIMLVMALAPFPHTLKDSISETAIPVAAETWEIHYTMVKAALLQAHTTQNPSADLEPLWGERVLNNIISRTKIRQLIHFIMENEAIKRW
ncbi:hypothetical protein AVEN_201105-1 [Araneus ventricosus]|uniref:Uncharacterized protein n=1 Tax=Araneus ventricosus TaxID=182803 RepID=A0A4Y2SG53_ARAVE|nr:hypothetical protein AVEN_201105-1 [Araneus ventricosus]